MALFIEKFNIFMPGLAGADASPWICYSGRITPYKFFELIARK